MSKIKEYGDKRNEIFIEGHGYVDSRPLIKEMELHVFVDKKQMYIHINKNDDDCMQIRISKKDAIKFVERLQNMLRYME